MRERPSWRWGIDGDGGELMKSALLAGDPAETAMAGICPLCYRLQQRSQPLLMLLQVRKIMSSRRPFAKHLADRSSGCLE